MIIVYISKKNIRDFVSFIINDNNNNLWLTLEKITITVVFYFRKNMIVCISNKTIIICICIRKLVGFPHFKHNKNG